MIPNNLLPPGVEYFIAGGYAVCPALATDRDVFVQTTGNLEDIRAMLLDYMRANGFTVVEESKVDVSDAYDGGIVEISKVGKVLMGTKGLPIHVLVTQADVQDVLNTFDITTSQVAITRTGKVVKGNSWTSPARAPQITKSIPSTPERLVKYQLRFGHSCV
jgi:hypothetical protein